jgi:hypothetical protein
MKYIPTKGGSALNGGQGAAPLNGGQGGSAPLNNHLYIFRSPKFY